MLTRLDFETQKDPIIARLILQRVRLFINSTNPEPTLEERMEMISPSEAEVVFKHTVEEDKEHYKTELEAITRTVNMQNMIGDEQNLVKYRDFALDHLDLYTANPTEFTLTLDNAGGISATFNTEECTYLSILLDVYVNLNRADTAEQRKAVLNHHRKNTSH